MRRKEEKLTKKQEEVVIAEKVPERHSRHESENKIQAESWLCVCCH